MQHIISGAIAYIITNKEKDKFDLWMQVRATPGRLQGLWEFPGGKLEANETPIVALLRELHEEISLPLNLLQEANERGEVTAHKLYSIPHAEKPSDSILLHTFIFSLSQHSINLFKHTLGTHGQWFSIPMNGKIDFLKGQIPASNHQLITDLIETLI